MNETKKILTERYNELKELISICDINDTKYQKLLDEQDKIRNEMIKLNQIETENEVKREQIKAENKREIIRNVITIVTTAGTIGVSIWTILKSFEFDKDSTMTSTVGKSLVTGVATKLFKR